MASGWKHRTLIVGALRIALPLGAVIALIGLLPAGDERYLFEQSVGILTDSTLAWVERQPDLDASEPIPVLLLEKSRVMRPSQTPPALRLALEDRFDRFAARGGRKLEWLETPGHPPPLSIVFRPEPGRTRAVAIWRPPGSVLQRRELVQPHYRRFALLPPLVAIVLALVTRRALLSLALGAFLGAMLVGVQEAAMVPVPPGATSFPNPVAGLLRLITDYGWKRSFEDQFRVEVVGFVAALVAAIGVMTRGGAMGGLVNVIIRRARTAVGTRLAAAVLGIVVFFDDYTNCIVVGNTMRPLTDRMRISREKLSYIVDSTAAPDAGLAIVSTWVAYEISTFAPQLKAVGVTDDPYAIFLRTMPYRFYCLFTLFLVYAAILLRRDFGPMLAAERRAGTTGKVIRDGGTPLTGSQATAVAEKPGVPRRWWNAVLPLAVMIFGSLFEMVRIGRESMPGPVDLRSLAGLRQVLAGTSSAKALFHGSIMTWLAAAGLMLGQRILSWREIAGASLRAASGISLALAILFLAWAIGGVTSDLGTAQVLVSLFKSSMPPFLLPILLFLISCAVSFATGTSWGTMAIVLPNTVILAYTLGEHFAGGPLGLTILSIGAVLEGSIFGDHCSPVSDTTILSSMATGSDHLDHVETQMPYAILAMLVALLIGYLPAALGVHPGISLSAGALAIVGFLLLRGGDPDLGRVEPAVGEGGAR